MLPRVLTFLRCPECISPLSIAEELKSETVPMPAAGVPEGCGLHGSSGRCEACWTKEIELGILACPSGHRFPIVGGVPRMETGSMARFREHFPSARGDSHDAGGRDEMFGSTRTSFSLEWDLWQPGDKTWIWNLEERKRIFAEDVELRTLDRSRHRVVLDAGCGNGQLSAGIATLGLEVVGLDLASGVERAHRLKREVAGERAPFVHYVQGNLAMPPFAPDTFDVVYSSGVLHHTPNTEETFRRVLPLTKKDGRAYVWLYSSKRKPVKRVVTAALRVATVRMPPDTLRTVCEVMAEPVNRVTSVLTKLKIRETPPRSAREMAVSLYDEFSPRYQHHHDEGEVEAWYRSLGFSGMNVCSVDRNGFGMRAMRS